jgi:hypothetical protein
VTAELTTFVDIDAPPERVWDVLTDVPAYPTWNPFVVSAEGEFAVGQRLALRLPPLAAAFRVTLRPTVVEATPHRRLQFRLRLARLGIPGLFDSEQTLTITPRDGGVRLWEQARFSGLLVPLLTRSLNRDRSQAFSDMNAALKARIEGRSPGPG